MKKIILSGILILILMIVGCSQKVVCNKPYILVGSECCLDKDNNGICDKDEIKEEPKVEVKEEAPKVTGAVITDVKEEISKTPSLAEYSVYDLQNDLNNIYGGVFTWLKSETKDVNYYRSSMESNIKEVVDEKNPKMIYYISVDYRNVIIEELKNKKIETFEEFKKSIEKDFGLYKENITNKRKSFEDEYKKDFKEEYGINARAYTYYRFANLSKETGLSSDELNVLDQGETPIIATLYTSLDNYKFNYIIAYKEDKLNTSTLTSQKKDQFFDFKYSISILCRPNLVVHLSENKIKKQTMGEDYEKGEVENQIEVIKTKIISEAKKIAEVCS